MGGDPQLVRSAGWRGWGRLDSALSGLADPGALPLAVAAPQGDFFYFVAGCPNGNRDGSHYFARTNAEHQANIARANEECPA